jgi:hypothetical protein
MGYAKGTIVRSRMKLRTPKDPRVNAYVDSNYATNLTTGEVGQRLVVLRPIPAVFRYSFKFTAHRPEDVTDPDVMNLIRKGLRKFHTVTDRESPDLNAELP